MSLGARTTLRRGELQRLETAGLVERHHSCGDRRATCVGLTPADRTQAPHLREVLVELDIRVYAQLPPEQLATLRRALNSIRFVVDNGGDVRPPRQALEIPA
ncbi:MAG: MarR family winged helix-turn-helix transcriptional regulator [Terriglobia bacterium]